MKDRQFGRIAIVSLKPGSAYEAIRRTENGLLPLYRSQPGFAAYTAVKTGDASLISLSVWQTREQAVQAIQTEETWVKQHATDLVESMQNHVGELGFLSSTGDLASLATVAPVATLPA
jgi:heme-degrading monooxygenase HmoA